MTVTKAERKQANRKLAEWCRTVGVAPTGQAWVSALAGERDPVTLVTMNLSDGVAARRLPDGTRLPGGLRSGDYLPDHDGMVACAPLFDSETGSIWVTLNDGRDLKLHPLGAVTCTRKRQAPDWVKTVHDEYLSARAQWELDREADSNGWVTEMREFAERVPAPRYADHVKAYWEGRREAG